MNFLETLKLVYWLFLLHPMPCLNKISTNLHLFLSCFLLSVSLSLKDMSSCFPYYGFRDFSHCFFFSYVIIRKFIHCCLQVIEQSRQRSMPVKYFFKYQAFVNKLEVQICSSQNSSQNRSEWAYCNLQPTGITSTGTV